MDRPLIVYVLGAGFSRPLGLPLVSDFIGMAKDLYFRDPKTFEQIGRVLERIQSLAVVKNTLHSDLSNIEEVLSLVAMQDALGGELGLGEIQRFVAEVIGQTTPMHLIPKPAPAIEDERVRLGGTPWAWYVPFVEALLGVGYCRPSGLEIATVDRRSGMESEFSVVSLNYDLVLETCADRLRTFAPDRQLHGFLRAGDPGFEEGVSGRLAKLHGTVERPEGIVPMTLTKSLRGEILPIWRTAHRMLSVATEIRFIGYSLPPGDGFVRYLLKAAMTENRRLRRISALALDPRGVVRRRFHQFIKFPGFEFIDGNVSDYLGVFRGLQAWEASGSCPRVTVETHRYGLSSSDQATTMLRAQQQTSRRVRNLR